MLLIDRCMKIKKSLFINQMNSDNTFNLQDKLLMHEIVFSDEKKAHSYFIDGVWSKIYFKYQDLTEMRNHLSSMLNRECIDSKNAFTIEGLKVFYKADCNSWVSTDDKYGQISIKANKLMD